MSFRDLFGATKDVPLLRSMRLPIRRECAVTCAKCALTYAPSPRWQSCPGCEATRGRRLREAVEAALMELRADRSKGR